MVICLGAGDITKWAAGLADGIARRGRAMSASPPFPGARPADRRGAARALVWFKPGGTAEWLFEPADVDDLSDFLPDSIRVPVMALGLGSNLIVRDGGVPGVSSGSASRSPRSSGSMRRPCAAAAARAASWSPRPRATPASAASNSCARSRARSAASCG
jgi:hypothetical protein